MSLILRAYPGDFVVQTALTLFVAVTLIAGVALMMSALLGRRPAIAHCLLLWALVWILVTPLITAAATASGFSLISIPLRFGNRTLLPEATPKPTLLTRAAETPQPIADAQRPSVKPSRQFAPESPRRSTEIDAAAPVIPSLTAVAMPSPATRLAADSVDAPKRLSRRQVAATVFLAVWLAGTGLLLGALVRSFARMRAIRRSCVPLDPNAFLDGQRLGPLIDEVRRRVGVESIPTITSSERVSTPCVLGIIRPAVVLPPGVLCEISHGQLADVLVHECAHVVRRDCLAVMGQRLAAALFWLNPLVLLLNRSLTRVREEVCDNYVLAGTDASSYGETLLRIAELARGARPMAATVGILHWRGRLERRIAGLIDDRRRKQTRAGYRVAIVALASFGCLCFAACDASLSSDQPAPPGDKQAGDAHTSDVPQSTVPPAPPVKTPEKSKSEPSRRAPRDLKFRRWWWDEATPSTSNGSQDNTGFALVKDRPHTLSISEAQRVKLGIRKDGVDQIAIVDKPKRMPPYVTQGSTYIPPTATVRLRVFPSPAGCKIQEISRISVPGPLKGEVTFREIQARDQVKKGQLLAVLYSGDVANTMNDLVDAAAQLKLDEVILKRTVSVEPGTPPSVLHLTAERNVLADKNAMTRALRTLRGWDIPDTQIHQALAEAAKVNAAGGSPELLQTKNWGRLELRSPIDGVVLARNVNDGEAVIDNTTSLFTVANLDTLFVIATIPEAKLPALRAVGPNPTWTITTRRGDVYTGTITALEPKDNWSALRGPIDNSRGLLRGGGETVSITIPLAVPPDVVEIPSACLVNEGQQDTVFVQKDPSKAEYTLQRLEIVDRLPRSVLVRSKPFAKEETSTEEPDGTLPKEPLLPGSRLLQSGHNQDFPSYLKGILQQLEVARPGTAK